LEVMIKDPVHFVLEDVLRSFFFANTKWWN